VQGAQRGPELVAPTGPQSREPVAGIRVGRQLGEVQFEQQGRALAGQRDHAYTVKARCLPLGRCVTL
jgi:hypothetical protein